MGEPYAVFQQSSLSKATGKSLSGRRPSGIYYIYNQTVFPKHTRTHTLSLSLWLLLCYYSLLLSVFLVAFSIYREGLR
jgi:hypothetical protein